MNPFKKVLSNEMTSYLEESRGLERDYLKELINARNLALKGAYLLGFIAIFAILAAFLSFYRKPPEPHILRVDNATGSVEVLNHLKKVETTYGEVVDSYWLNQYVLNREGYDDHTIQTMYDTTALLSTPDVQKEYYALFEGESARHKALKDHTRILVEVKSITPDVQNGTAVVRFLTRERTGSGISAPKHFIATIGYEYLSAAMSVQDRRLNPLGFQVTSYRVDPEVLSTVGDAKS